MFQSAQRFLRYGLYPLLTLPYVVDIEEHSQGKLKLSGPDALGTMVLDFFGVHFMKNGSFYAFAREEGCVT